MALSTVASASRSISVASRNITVASRNITVACRNITVACRNITVASRNTTVASRRPNLLKQPKHSGLDKGFVHHNRYAATCRTVCYGWRVGIVKSIVIVTAAAVYYLTLPYLTLLTLPYFTYLLTRAKKTFWYQIDPL